MSPTVTSTTLSSPWLLRMTWNLIAGVGFDAQLLFIAAPLEVDAGAVMPCARSWLSTSAVTSASLLPLVSTRTWIRRSRGHGVDSTAHLLTSLADLQTQLGR